MSPSDTLQARIDAFAALSLRFVNGLPHCHIAQTLAGQYQVCSMSAAANLRAAPHARSREEFAVKLGIVAEEAFESVCWLKRFVHAKVHSSGVELGSLVSDAEQLARILDTSHRTAMQRKRR
jgi:four helix bundle protein